MAGELRKTLKKKAPTITAGAVATATIAILSRFLDTAGTLIGACLASALSGTAATIYEHLERKAVERTKRLAQRGRQVKVTKKDVWDHLYGPKRTARRKDIPWKRISILTSIFLVLMIAVASGVEALSHRPLAVTGSVTRPTIRPSSSPPSEPSQEFSPSPSSITSYTRGPSPSSVPSPSISSPSPSPSSSPQPSSSSTTIPTPSPSPGE